MQVTLDRGMVRVEGHPEPRAIVDRFSVNILDFQTGELEPVKFAVSRNGVLWVPICAYKKQAALEWRVPTRIFKAQPEFALWQYQIEAKNKWKEKRFGCLKGPAGSGKTVIGIEQIRHFGVKSCGIVPTVDIAEQWKENMRVYCGVEVGILGGGKKQLDKPVVASTFQSAIKHKEFLRSVDLIMVDEVHRCPCRTIRDILSFCPAYYRYGCTATPWRADGLHKALDWLLGGVEVEVDRQDASHKLAKPTVEYLQTTTSLWGDHNEQQAAVAYDAERNDLLAAKIEELRSAGHSVIALGQRVNHLEEMKSRFPDAHVLQGSTKRKDRTTAIESMRSGESTLLFATYKLAAEALDIPRLSALVMLAPIGNYTQVEQACGRIMRKCEGKLSPIVVDVQDIGESAVALGGKRKTVYRRIGMEG